VEAQPATPGCPNDLFLTTDEYGERADNVLAAYLPPAQDPLWEIPLGYESVVDFAAADGRVFALLTSGTLIAIDVADCGEAWRVDLGRAPGAVTGGLDVEDGTLVVTASSRVSAYEAADGTNLWSDSLATPARRPLLREGIAVIAGDTTPWLRSYDVPEGGLYFDESAGFSGPIESMDADFDAVYLAGGGKVEGRWIDDGTSLFSVSSSLTSGVTLFDVYAYVIGEDSVAALDFDTGEEIWSTELADRALPALGIAADGVLVFTQDGQANRLDFDAGFATPGGDYGAFRVFPEFDDDLFLVTSDDGTVTAYNLFEEAMFTLPTGANGLDRFTHLEFVDDTVVTNTFSAERF
jgi:outer membrane protein assembly factor BamB